VSEVPAHLAGATQADVDPDLQPAATSDHAPAVVGAPFATSRRSRAGVGWPSRRLLRLFAGTGVLGGYTTFSTYIGDIQQLLAAGAARTALTYLTATLFAALAAVYSGIIVTRWAVRRIHHPKEKAR
jgi:drug/metabolite transporter (DMT)-like permease